MPARAASADSDFETVMVKKVPGRNRLCCMIAGVALLLGLSACSVQGNGRPFEDVEAAAQGQEPRADQINDGAGAAASSAGALSVSGNRAAEDKEEEERPEQTAAGEDPAAESREGVLFAPCGRSGRVPEYLGEELYEDYCRLIEALYAGDSRVTLSHCRGENDLRRLENCVRTYYLPIDLLRDPLFLGPTPFSFSPDTGSLEIFYCWEDGSLEEGERPCSGPEEYRERIAAFRKRVEGILAVLPEAGEEERALALFDLLAEGMTYEIDRNDTPFTALEDHRGYCSVFAALFQFLAEEAGIPCLRCSGATEFGWRDHEWNLIRLQGNWYHADATYQNSDHYAEGYFFGMSDESCAALGHGDSADFVLSDPLSEGERPPECADGSLDRIFRPWMTEG